MVCLKKFSNVFVFRLKWQYNKTNVFSLNRRKPNVYLIGYSNNFNKTEKIKVIFNILSCISKIYLEMTLNT